MISIMERFFLVYKTTNKIKGEYYIGVHVTDDLEDGYLGSGKRLIYSLSKYGRDAFEREILATFNDPDEMFQKEAELVNEETLKDPLCLNLKVGGHGGWLLKDKSALYTAESQAIRSPYGKKEWREKNAEKIREWTAKGLSSARQKLYEMKKSGYKPVGMLGKHHTEEHKNHMSQVMSVAQAGERNSQYGKCWIYSTTERQSKRVMKEDVQGWLDKGWSLGRKMKFD